MIRFKGIFKTSKGIFKCLKIVYNIIIIIIIIVTVPKSLLRDTLVVLSLTNLMLGSK